MRKRNDDNILTDDKEKRAKRVGRQRLKAERKNAGTGTMTKSRARNARQTPKSVLVKQLDEINRHRVRVGQKPLKVHPRQAAA